MSGCHVPLTKVLFEPSELEKIKDRVENLEKVLFPKLDVPSKICGHCAGIGRIADDGIL